MRRQVGERKIEGWGDNNGSKELSEASAGIKQQGASVSLAALFSWTTHGLSNTSMDSSTPLLSSWQPTITTNWSLCRYLKQFGLPIDGTRMLHGGGEGHAVRSEMGGRTSRQPEKWSWEGGRKLAWHLNLPQHVARALARKAFGSNCMKCVSVLQLRKGPRH